MTQRLAGELCQLGHPSQTCYLCFKTKECKSRAPYEWAGELSSAVAIWWPLKGSPGHIYHKLHWPWAAPAKCGPRASYPTIEQSSPAACLPLPGIHQRCRAETDKPVLQAMVGEAASLELPPSS